jgi:hypothetical protein
MRSQGKIGGSQGGITFISFLLNCLLIGFAALIIMRLFPLYTESFKVSNALKNITQDPEIGQKSVRDIQGMLLKQMEIDDVDRFDFNNLRNYLTVKPNARGMRVLTMTYESRGPLLGNLDVVLKFDESLTIAGTASE